MQPDSQIVQLPQCITSKREYGSIMACIQACADHTDRRGLGMPRPYKCRFCDRWHMTSSRGTFQQDQWDDLVARSILGLDPEPDVEMQEKLELLAMKWAR
jgi:hypothetical protein